MKEQKSKNAQVQISRPCRPAFDVGYWQAHRLIAADVRLQRLHSGKEKQIMEDLLV